MYVHVQADLLVGDSLYYADREGEDERDEETGGEQFTVKLWRKLEWPRTRPDDE
jgi:hypothetical protein